MKSVRTLISIILLSLCLALPATAASIPTTLSYQGTMVDKSGQPVTATKSITFNLYDVATEGTAFWTEVQTVTITNGQFTAQLGANQANPLDISTFGGDTWLGLTISGEPEMTPREKMTSVPYAFNGVPKGVIVMWSGSIDAIPRGWVLCDGAPGSGTPNLKDRFIVGAGNSYAVGATGGSASMNLQHQHEMPHDHDMNHEHYGYGNGGDLRAAIGAASGRADTIAYIGESPINPYTFEGGFTSTYYIVGATASGSSGFSHFTPVYGRTSPPNSSLTGPTRTPSTQPTGTNSQDIRPPYYALAYIMKQ